MKLIFKRLVSSTINGTIILFFFIIISFFVACFFWFFPFYSDINMKYFFVIFSIGYTLIGSMSKCVLPGLGRRITGIEIRGVMGNTPTHIKTRIFIRTILFYTMPIGLLYTLNLPFQKIVDGEPKMALLLMAPILFFAFSSSLIIPISILIGKGQQGIHDAFTGILTCTGNKIKTPVVHPKNLTVRSIIATSIISAIFMACFFTFLSFFKLQDMIFKFVNIAENKGTNCSIVQELDSLIPATPLKYRSFVIENDFKWWVDFSKDKKVLIDFNKAIGLKQLNLLDLIGYGFSIEKLQKPMNLIDVGRSKTSTLSEGSTVLSFFTFVDIGAFYHSDIIKQIDKYFEPYVNKYAVSIKCDALRIKTIRIVKVGLIKIGIFREFYINNEGAWHSVENLYYPYIIDINSRLINRESLIINSDLE